MATSVTVRNLLDSYVASATPTKNYGSVATMYVGTGYISYIYWGNPIPAGARVVSAKLHLFSASTWSGSVTLSAQALTAAWSANKITYNNDPGGTGSTATQTKSGAAKGTHWIIDITSLMQSVANGQKWYGLRVLGSGASAKALYSIQASAAYRPYVELSWSDNPLPPSNLSPTGGGTISTPTPILSFSFLDVSGNRSMAGMQVQISTVATFASTVYDSGSLTATVPQLDLSTTAFSATAGTLYYWRVKTQDGAGLWSDWSANASFKYVAPPTLTLSSPSVANAYVEEPSPPVTWIFTGTQTAYRVLVSDPTVPGRYLYDSGTVSSTNLYHTIPAGAIKTNAYTYTLTVRVWDNQSRVAVPGWPPYQEAELNFVYQYNASTSPCSSIAAAMDSNNLAVVISTHRSTVPDYFTLVRDGKVVKTNIPGPSVQDSVDTTLFTFTDYPPGRRTVVYTVIPVVNGKSASSNPTANIAVRRTFSWVCAPDGTFPVAFANPVHDVSDGELSAVLSAVSGPPILVTQALYLESGSFSGTISQVTVTSLTARTMRDNLRAIRSSFSGHAMLLFADEVMDVYIHHLKVTRVSYPDGTTDYDASFEFFQVA